LANPGRVSRQLTGVYHPDWLAPMAETLGALGADHAWIVHGQGHDELTLAGETQVAEWRDGSVRRFTVTPADAGLPSASVNAIRGGDAAHNAAALLALLQGEASPYRDTVLLNTAAALIIAGRADTLRHGVQRAESAIDSTAALDVLDKLRRETAALLTE
jgi:anthranilate phosphoribosyltransferase